ncbi:hypothetical protein AWJ20_4249 [Sugiyamaella lignohabitans]|uniref:DASH complex subunit SPC34 n=1 Tax=Sugiyamaella lignohabitans TaxID=796027 RepID=A0A167CAS0_9ASCO|nr:uncharacterized protein AWJ20_4249 [Sugiyamaella lignohabitans]ANB11439.1 hypothetical protein AWJ20_4249 [Sugiyamaella lignohabitans]
MEFFTSKIKDTNASIQSIKFRRPGIFTNAVILKPEITSLIQDADNQEQALFQISGKSKQPVRVSHKPSSAGLPTEINSSDELSVDALCTAAERLAQIYPIEGLDSRVAYYRNKADQLNENIFKYEELVESQRRQLLKLNVTVESRGLIPEDQPKFQDAKTAAEEIRRLQEEVQNLESEISLRQQEVQNLEGRLLS